MGVVKKIIDWFNSAIRKRVEDIYDFTNPISQDMEKVIKNCANIYASKPLWVMDNNSVKTINVAKIICSETARLITLGLDVTITGQGERAKWLQEQIDTLFEDHHLRTYVEYGLAYGTIVFKPNGDSIDIFKPNEFMVISQHNGHIEDIVFFFKDVVDDNHYTRLERHQYEDGKVYITNKCYIGKEEYDLRTSVAIEKTPWADIEEEFEEESDGLFAVYKVADANNIDSNSPLGIPIFANSVNELQDCDIGYTRYSDEVYDSQKIVLLDSDRMVSAGTKIKPSNIEQIRENMKLPKYVRNVFGDGVNSFYQEINPELNTQTRLDGLRFLISLIGYKCGYSSGYFNLDQRSGMVTATQVEADDRRTIELIKDNREALESCLTQLVEALNTMADIMGIPDGTYEVAFDFEDITHNLEEDRNRWYSYVIAGHIPFWKFLVKFEGMTEEEAKEISTQELPQLFEDE